MANSMVPKGLTMNISRLNPVSGFFTSILVITLGSPALAGEPGSGKPRSHDHPHTTIISPNQADHLWVFAESKNVLGSGGEFRIFVDPETHPDARASFAEFALGSGGGLPVHRHDETEEIAYFLSGEGIVQTYEGDVLREVAVGPGQVWYNPPGAWHGIRNTGAEPLAMVFAVIPNEKDGLLSLFRRIGARPGEETTELPPEEFSRIAAEHDLILRPPPEQE